MEKLPHVPLQITKDLLYVGRRCLRALPAMLLLPLLLVAYGGGDASGASNTAGDTVAAMESSATPLAVQDSIDAGMLLDWAEGQYPELFPTGPVNQQLTDAGVTYTLRYYPSTFNYLGVATGGNVYGLGGFTNNVIQGFGKISDYTCQVAPNLCTPQPTAVGVATGAAASATIGAAGGSVSSPDGKIALTIPAGALISDTVIGIQPFTNLAHGKIGAGYRLTPDGQTFASPVTLTFSYTDQDLEGTAVEALGTAFQTAEGYWQWAGDATVDTAAKTVNIASSHFTDWSLVKGLQIRPAKKTVEVNGTVALQVKVCYQIDFANQLNSLGYNCDNDDDVILQTILNPVSEWSINGVLGGGGVFGTVSGSGQTATYTAPGTEPIPNTVAVSARVNIKNSPEIVLVVSNITIVESHPTLSGTITTTQTESGGQVITTNANVTFVWDTSQGQGLAFYQVSTAAVTTTWDSGGGGCVFHGEWAGHASKTDGSIFVVDGRYLPTGTTYGDIIGTFICPKPEPLTIPEQPVVWWPAAAQGVFEVKPDGRLEDSFDETNSDGTHIIAQWLLVPQTE